jgi:FkbM family methyltransferase
VGVAFTSSAKRMASTPGSAIEQSDAVANALSTPLAMAPSRRRSINARLKAFLRPIAKLIFAGARPFLHPVAFRVRAYLLGGFRQGLQQELAATLAELKEIKLDLRDQINLYQTGITRLDRIEQHSVASSRRVAVNCGLDVILVHTKVGYLLCSALDYAVVACLIDRGDINTGTRLLIQTFLRPGNIFVDIGANAGFYTLAAACAMKGQGRIIAFEPRHATLLAESLRINGFAAIVEINGIGVSNDSGHATLFGEGRSSYQSPSASITQAPLDQKTVEVRDGSLGDVVLPNTKVDLIKITVDGGELDILESAKLVIAGNPSIALIVEFCFSHLKRTGHTTASWLAAFQHLGFAHRVIDADTGQLEDWGVAQLEARTPVNLFMARPNSVAWAKAGSKL